MLTFWTLRKLLHKLIIIKSYTKLIPPEQFFQDLRISRWTWYLLMNISHGECQLQKHFDCCQDNSTIGVLKSVFQQIHNVKNIITI